MRKPHDLLEKLHLADDDDDGCTRASDHVAQRSRESEGADADGDLAITEKKSDERRGHEAIARVVVGAAGWRARRRGPAAGRP